MSTQEKNKERFCLFCDRRIETGARPEKVYCNVDCKNNYNSRKKAELKAQGSPYQIEILKIIKNNYQILLKYKDSDKGLKRKEVAKQELIDKGFIPIFFTSTNETPDHGLWKCCFDICFMEAGDNHYNLSFKPIKFYTDEDEPDKVIMTQM